MAQTSGWKSNKLILKTTGWKSQHKIIKTEFLSFISFALHKNHSGIEVRQSEKDWDKSKIWILGKILYTNDAI